MPKYVLAAGIPPPRRAVRKGGPVEVHAFGVEHHALPTGTNNDQRVGWLAGFLTYILEPYKCLGGGQHVDALEGVKLAEPAVPCHNRVDFAGDRSF